MILHDHQCAAANPLALTRQNGRLNTPGITDAIDLRFDLRNIGPIIHGCGMKAVIAPEAFGDASEVLGKEYCCLSNVHHRPDRVELHEHELISFKNTAATDMAAVPQLFNPTKYNIYNEINDLSAKITIDEVIISEGSPA